MSELPIVDKLIELRDKKHLTNYTLAIKSNLPPSTVANVLNKQTTPQLATLIAICNGLEITLAQFFNEDKKYSELSDKEVRVLKLWNSLDDNQQKIIINVLEQFNKK